MSGPAGSPGSPSGSVFCVERRRGPVWFAKYRLSDGREVRRRLGPAWTEGGRPPVGHYTERTAKAWLRKTLDAARAGELPAVARPGVGFADVAAEWLRQLEHEPGREPATLRAYRSALDRHLLPAFADLPLEELTRDRIKAWRARMRGAGRRPANRAANEALSTLAALLEWAREVYWLHDNPARAIERRERREARRLELYSPEEAAALGRAAADPRDAAIFTTVALTGLRLDELLALRWRDLDFKRGVIRREAGAVAMVDAVAASLAELRRSGERTAANDPVIAGDDRSRLDQGALRRRLAAAQERAGLWRLPLDQLALTAGGRVTVEGSLGARSSARARLAVPAEPARQLAAPRSLAGEQPPFGATAAGSPDVFVNVVEGATMTTARRGAFAIVDRDGQPVEGSAVRGDDLELVGSRPVRRERLGGTVCDLTAPGADLFSHFLFDTLPKCHVLARAGIQLADVDTFLINSIDAPFHRELLARAGVDLARVKERNRPSFPDVFEVERLVWVSPIRSGLLTPSWAIEFVRGLVDWSPQPEAARRIYISRSDAPRRRVVNEAEVRTLVEELGFEVVSASSLTVAEMAQITAGARCVVGTHGAGMVNIAFAPAPAAVVELYGWHLSVEYWLLCEQIGHRYYCLECAAPDGGRDVAAVKSKRDRNEADLIVDLDRLAQMLEGIR